MKAGDKVRFVSIIDDGDELLEFIVLEERGDDVLVRVTNGVEMAIMPTGQYSRDALEVI